MGEQITRDGKPLEPCIKILENFLNKKHIKVDCIKDPFCKEGNCKATISLKNGKYTLITGIMVGADVLGVHTFNPSDIRSSHNQCVFVRSFDENNKICEMKLSPYLEK